MKKKKKKKKKKKCCGDLFALLTPKKVLFQKNFLNKNSKKKNEMTFETNKFVTLVKPK